MVRAYAIPKSSIPCYFFQRGNCDRGANCSFMHAPLLHSPKLPQLNPSLTRTSNDEVNTQACKDQNDSPCLDSSDMSSDSDDSLGIIAENNPSYYLGSVDWYGPFHHFSCQLQTWHKIQARYSTSENSLHRSSQSGMKRPLEQDAESKIRQIDEQPESKLRRLDNNSPATTCTEMPTDNDDDDERKNGCTTERNTSAATLHNDERRGSPNSRGAQHMEPKHGSCSRERERGFGKRNGMNGSHFSPLKDSAELKRTKTSMEMKGNSTCSPKPISVLLKKKREAMSGGGK